MSSTVSKTVMVLNGPNLNMLGIREPEIYGSQSLDDVGVLVADRAKSHDLTTDFKQSNHEGELVTWIQQGLGAVDGFIINAGALTHTSVALHDAFKSVNLPMIEVHLSNVYQREDFRHKSYLSLIANGVICGFGVDSYLLAVDAMAKILTPDT
jgi:3-dehydroquinate dehydratase II